MNFIRFTSEGGYLGRFFWANTGSVGTEGGWGCFTAIPSRNRLGTGWAGDVWVVRCFAPYWRLK